MREREINGDRRKKMRRRKEKHSWTEGKGKEEKKKGVGPLVLTSKRAVML